MGVLLGLRRSRGLGEGGAEREVLYPAEESEVSRLV